MSPPSHVQAVCALTNVIFITAGLRDLLSPGSPLPMPNDDRLMLLWGNTITKKHGVVAAPVDGAMLFLAQCWGMLLITVALAKVCVVWSERALNMSAANMSAARADVRSQPGRCYLVSCLTCTVLSTMPRC